MFDATLSISAYCYEFEIFVKNKITIIFMLGFIKYSKVFYTFYLNVIDDFKAFVPGMGGKAAET